ncbi:hypothetical protein ACJ41O_006472 [Fusarium nematophilum]
MSSGQFLECCGLTYALSGDDITWESTPIHPDLHHSNANGELAPPQDLLSAFDILQAKSYDYDVSMAGQTPSKGLFPQQSWNDFFTSDWWDGFIQGRATIPQDSEHPQHTLSEIPCLTADTSLHGSPADLFANLPAVFPPDGLKVVTLGSETAEVPIASAANHPMEATDTKPAVDEYRLTASLPNASSDSKLASLQLLGVPPRKSGIISPAPSSPAESGSVDDQEDANWTAQTTPEWRITPELGAGFELRPRCPLAPQHQECSGCVARREYCPQVPSVLVLENQEDSPNNRVRLIDPPDNGVMFVDPAINKDSNGNVCEGNSKIMSPIGEEPVAQNIEFDEPTPSGNEAEQPVEEKPADRQASTSAATNKDGDGHGDRPEQAGRTRTPLPPEPLKRKRNKQEVGQRKRNKKNNQVLKRKKPESASVRLQSVDVRVEIKSQIESEFKLETVCWCPRPGAWTRRESSPIKEPKFDDVISIKGCVNSQISGLTFKKRNDGVWESNDGDYNIKLGSHEATQLVEHPYLSQECTLIWKVLEDRF